jgi:hypothetical protein
MFTVDKNYRELLRHKATHNGPDEKVRTGEEVIAVLETNGRKTVIKSKR